MEGCKEVSNWSAMGFRLSNLVPRNGLNYTELLVLLENNSVTQFFFLYSLSDTELFRGLEHNSDT